MFKSNVLETITGISNVDFVRNTSVKGLFGGNPRPDDLEITYMDNKILLECKVLGDKSESRSDIRNSFGQVLEYLLSPNWRAGYVVIFDTREVAGSDSGNLFTESGNATQEENDRVKLRLWYAKLHTMKDCPVPIKNDWEKVIISAVRIYPTNDGIGIEMMP